MSDFEEWLKRAVLGEDCPIKRSKLYVSHLRIVWDFQQKRIDNLLEAVETIKNADTCRHVYPNIEKYNNHELGWYGVIEFAEKALEKDKQLKEK